MQMIIYSPTGTEILDAPVTKEAIIKYVLMGDYYIELPFNLLEPTTFARGSYITYKGRKFEIMSTVRPEFDNKTGGYKYTLPNSIVGSNAKHRSVFSQSVISIEAAMHTIVIKTLTGMAQAACVAIDSCIGDKIVGSIAGDDTILIITKDVEKAKEAEKALNDMLKNPA